MQVGSPKGNEWQGFFSEVLSFIPFFIQRDRIGLKHRTF